MKKISLHPLKDKRKMLRRRNAVLLAAFLGFLMLVTSMMSLFNPVTAKSSVFDLLF